MTPQCFSLPHWPKKNPHTPLAHTCSSIWMLPACSSSSSSWSFTLASRSRTCFLTLDNDASSLVSWEERSCSSASSRCTFAFAAHSSPSLSYRQRRHGKVHIWTSPRYLTCRAQGERTPSECVFGMDSGLPAASGGG